MEIDKNKLAAIAELDDKTFANIIKEAIIAAGGNEMQAKTAMAAAPLIKSKLKNASDGEINQIISFVGQTNAENIINKLKM